MLRSWRGVILVFAAVTAWALFGILTRPSGGLAALWPANAVLLGLFLRLPMLLRPSGWLAASTGYLAADLVTGGDLPITLLLTAANLAGVAVGLLIFRRVPKADLSLSRPLSVTIMVAVLLAASACSGLVGALAENFLFGSPYLKSFVLWTASDLVNYSSFMPIMLTVRPIKITDVIGKASALYKVTVSPGQILPLVSVLLLTFAGTVVGGPGSLTFPVPALLWSAVIYPPLANAVLAFVFIAATLLAVKNGHLPLLIDTQDPYAVLSLDMGVIMIALAPMTLAIVMASRNRMLDRFRLIAITDQLTGLLNRVGFVQASNTLIAQSQPHNSVNAMLMIDIDHFKSVNDTHGHQAGDTVLSSVARAMKDTIENSGVLGRLGGEEFCVLLPQASDREGEEMAKRIIQAVRELFISLGEAQQISVTVSIGLGMGLIDGGNLNDLMAKADRALYLAKARGRNRYMIADASECSKPQSATCLFDRKHYE